MIDSYLSQLDWSREPQGLYAPIAYTLESGGKRIRPTLALIACRLFGGKEKEVVPAALALEVFHNFTLLHDDVMEADFQDYQALEHKFADAMQTQAALRDTYGNTYWYYYQYGNR